MIYEFYVVMMIVVGMIIGCNCCYEIVWLWSVWYKCVIVACSRVRVGMKLRTILKRDFVLEIARIEMLGFGFGFKTFVLEIMF